MRNAGSIFDDGRPADHFMMGDILELDGTPWICCMRSLLKSALERLKRDIRADATVSPSSTNAS